MNTTNEEMDRLVGKAVKMSSLEKPDKGFSFSVMDKIEGLAEQKVINNERTPLISQTGWMVVAGLILMVFSILLLSDPTTISITYFDNYISTFNNIDFTLPISVSKIFLTGLFAFVFFFIIEISLITKRLNKI